MLINPLSPVAKCPRHVYQSLAKCSLLTPQIKARTLPRWGVKVRCSCFSQRTAPSFQDPGPSTKHPSVSSRKSRCHRQPGLSFGLCGDGRAGLQPEESQVMYFPRAGRVPTAEVAAADLLQASRLPLARALRDPQSCEIYRYLPAPLASAQFRFLLFRTNP